MEHLLKIFKILIPVELMIIGTAIIIASVQNPLWALILTTAILTMSLLLNRSNSVNMGNSILFIFLLFFVVYFLKRINPLYEDLGKTFLLSQIALSAILGFKIFIETKPKSIWRELKNFRPGYLEPRPPYRTKNLIKKTGTAIIISIIIPEIIRNLFTIVVSNYAFILIGIGILMKILCIYFLIRKIKRRKKIKEEEEREKQKMKEWEDAKKEEKKEKEEREKLVKEKLRTIEEKEGMIDKADLIFLFGKIGIPKNKNLRTRILKFDITRLILVSNEKKKVIWGWELKEGLKMIEGITDSSYDDSEIGDAKLQYKKLLIKVKYLENIEYEGVKKLKEIIEETLLTVKKLK